MEATPPIDVVTTTDNMTHETIVHISIPKSIAPLIASAIKGGHDRQEWEEIIGGCTTEAHAVKMATAFAIAEQLFAD